MTKRTNHIFSVAFYLKMDIALLNTLFRSMQVPRFGRRQPGQYKTSNIFGCYYTRLNGARCVLKSVHVIQVVPVQYKWRKFFRDLKMWVSSPIDSNDFLPHPVRRHISRNTVRTPQFDTLIRFEFLSAKT